MNVFGVFHGFDVLARCFLSVLLCVLAWSAFSRAASAASVPLRGIVEGFYGTPWNEDERLDMIAFCGRIDMNVYVYAPKDDPYHRERWREPYPAEQLEDLARLVEFAKTNNVHFVFAVSPGLSLHLSGRDAESDREAMLAKFESLYALGVRDFAVFFDDISNKDGARQAAFLNAVSEELSRRHEDLGMFLTVPTEYDRSSMMGEDGEATQYTSLFSSKLNKNILVLYTGEGVAKGNLTRDQREAANALYGRPLGIWWNYPVNDYQETKLALGPMDALSLDGVPVVLFNPMKHERLSKIALATGADLANDSAHYDAETSWKHAIQTQYGALAPAMQTFADHSAHLENDWADIGRPDAPEMQKEIDGLFAAIDQGAPEFITFERLHTLDKELAKTEKAVTMLEQQLDAKVLEECRPQLAQLARIIAADREGLRLLVQKIKGKEITTDSFQTLREEVLQHDADARISDQAARALLDELAKRI